MTKEVHSDTYPAINPTKTDHSGRAVFISGASKGIGKAIAMSFARAGASYIAVGARSDLSSVASELKQAAIDAGRAEPTILTLSLDVTDQKSVEAAAKQMDEKFGKLDVCINNAGISDEMVPLVNTTPDAWCKTWVVNVRGPYLITRSCIPLLLKGDIKTLITVSSVGAHVIMPGLSAYQPGKLAVVRLMEFIGAEHPEQGLVAFSVHPGNILTDIVGNGESLPEPLKPVFVDTAAMTGDTLVYLTNERRGWLNGRYVNCTWVSGLLQGILLVV